MGGDWKPSFLKGYQATNRTALLRECLRSLLRKGRRCCSLLVCGTGRCAKYELQRKSTASFCVSVACVQHSGVPTDILTCFDGALHSAAGLQEVTLGRPREEAQAPRTACLRIRVSLIWGMKVGVKTEMKQLALETSTLGMGTEVRTKQVTCGLRPQTKAWLGG